MKKLLQINSVVNQGSTGRIAEDIGLIAMQNGWESYIAFGRQSKESKSNLIKIGTSYDIIVHGVASRIFDKHGLLSKKATIKLINDIIILKPDIIHLHNLHGYYLNYPILFNYLKTLKIPIIWTIFDCWSFTGHCTYFDSVNCVKWKTQCFKCPQKREYPSSFIFDNSFNNFVNKKKYFTTLNNLTLLTNSHWLSSILDQSFLSNISKVVIPSAICLNTFSPKNAIPTFLKQYQNKFLILGVASEWIERKGFNDFIKLSTILNDEFLIILVGVNKKQKASLPRNIIGIEKTNNTEELSIIYSSCNVFINPTYEDNFPTTNLESIACGTPVITYDTGGSIESVDKHTGFIVKKGDIKSLVLAINEVKLLGKLFYNKACRERALKFYDKNIIYKKYIDLYNTLL